MRPGNWAGAYACWGTENREAAVRFLPATHGNPHGANVEVKVCDPSANTYLASAAILGLALGGIEHGAALPAEITVDPDTLTAEQRAQASVVQLSSRQSDSIAALERSTLLRAILGEAAVDALLAVRRYEQRNYCDLTPVELTDRFRMAWSV